MAKKDRPDFLPELFLKKMQLLLKDEYDDYLRCFDNPRLYGLRVNTAKISTERFLAMAPWPLRPIPWIKNGFYYDGSLYSPAKHPYYFAGLYYLQEPSAMTPASRLHIKPQDAVLDLCAAPGGKATELGARLSGTGFLVANDISSSRAKGLLKNLELAGIGNCAVTCEEPGRLADRLGPTFDKILVDAPCSGEGMFRKDKKMARAWLTHGPDYFIPIQKGILESAVRMLHPGGMLLYSTCTFDPGEDEYMIRDLLLSHPELSPVEMEDYAGFTPSSALFADMPQTACCRRLFPHRLDGEGHFLALLRKDREDKDMQMKRNMAEKEGQTRRIKSDPLPEELTVFFQNFTFLPDPKRIDIRGNLVFYMPDGMPHMDGIRTLRTGLLMGELKKNRFEPSQALAMWLTKDAYRYTIDLSAEDERVERYLKGETIFVEDVTRSKDRGWYLVLVDGYPLGFGKLSSGVLKNKYLPGWRLAG